MGLSLFGRTGMDDIYEQFWRDVYIAVVSRVGPEIAEQTANDALAQYKKAFQRIAVPGVR